MTYAAGRAHIRARKGENTLPQKKRKRTLPDLCPGAFCILKMQPRKSVFAQNHS